MPLDLGWIVRRTPAAVVALAADRIETLPGLARLHRTERAGKARPLVLAAVERRRAVLQRQDPPSRSTRIIAAGVGSAVGHGPATRRQRALDAMQTALRTAQQDGITDPVVLRRLQIEARDAVRS